jgi:hypothetical protein
MENLYNMRQVRDFLEAAKEPVEKNEIEAKTGASTNHEFPALERNGVIRTWWRLKEKRPGKPYSSYGFSDVTKYQLEKIGPYLECHSEKPVRLDQISAELKITIYEVRYALFTLESWGEVNVYFDLAPVSDCQICQHLKECQRLKNKLVPCNLFVDDWRLVV